MQTEIYFNLLIILKEEFTLLSFSYDINIYKYLISCSFTYPSSLATSLNQAGEQLLSEAVFRDHSEILTPQCQTAITHNIYFFCHKERKHEELKMERKKNTVELLLKCTCLKYPWVFELFFKMSKW